MTETDVPPFIDAVKKMEGFLLQQSRPSRIQWIFHEDATSYKQKVWVRLPIPPENGKLAEAHFTQGSRHGLGVQICALCCSSDVSYCYVWFPYDKLDAEYAMISGLKLSVVDTKYNLNTIENPFFWSLRKTFNNLQGQEGVVSILPTRKEAHNNQPEGISK